MGIARGSIFCRRLLQVIDYDSIEGCPYGLKLQPHLLNSLKDGSIGCVATAGGVCNCIPTSGLRPASRTFAWRESAPPREPRPRSLSWTWKADGALHVLQHREHCVDWQIHGDLI